MASAAVSVATAMTVTTNETVVTVNVTQSDESVTMTDALFAPEATKLVKTGTGILEFYPEEDSTYAGGTELSAGQFRIKSAGAIGTGGLSIGSYASLVVVDNAVTLTNRVAFLTDSCYAAAFTQSSTSPASLTLKNIAASSYLGSIRLGRTGNGAVSHVRLSLTDGDSEAVGRIFLSGGIDFWLDGGTVKAGDGAQSPFFARYTTDDPNVNVSPAGFAFDVSSGADVYPGQPLVFSKGATTNVLETIWPVNASFEDNATGWTFTRGPANEYLGVYDKNNWAFDGNGTYATTNGDYYAMVRRGATLESIEGVTMPSAGLWRVAGEVGCRPGGNYSLKITTSVIVDGETVGTIPSLASTNDLHTFMRFETAPIQMAAGNHSLKLVLSDGNANGSLNFDVLRFERVEIDEFTGPFEKSGDGRLHVGGLDYDGALTVSAGELALSDPSLDGAAVRVASGARLTLQTQGGADLSGADVQVASGGALAFSALGTNIVRNGSFEADGRTTAIPAGNPVGWTVEKTQSTAINKNGSGLQSNGGSVTGDGPLTPHGTTTAYLREYTSLSQTVNVPEAGTYRISWLQGSRSSYHSFQMPLAVSIGATAVAEPAQFTAAYGFTRMEADVELTAGDHVLSFATGAPEVRDGAGAMIFVDDVQMRKIGESGAVSGGTLNLSSGAEIVLDCLDAVAVESLAVDGVEVNGGKSALRRAGVTVSGTGDIFVGKPRGTVILIN